MFHLNEKGFGVAYLLGNRTKSSSVVYNPSQFTMAFIRSEAIVWSVLCTLFRIMEVVVGRMTWHVLEMNACVLLQCWTSRMTNEWILPKITWIYQKYFPECIWMSIHLTGTSRTKKKLFTVFHVPSCSWYAKDSKMNRTHPAARREEDTHGKTLWPSRMVVHILLGKWETLPVRTFQCD